MYVARHWRIILFGIPHEKDEQASGAYATTASRKLRSVRSSEVTPSCWS